MPVFKRLSGAIVAVFMLVLTTPVLAQDAVRAEKIRAFLHQVSFPYSQRIFQAMFDDVERRAASQFVGGLGNSAGLGAAWRPGNPAYDRAIKVVNQALERDQAANGPIFTITRAEVESLFNPPWTNEELDFATNAVQTEYGRAFMAMLDLMLVPVFTEQFSNNRDFSPELVAQIARLRDEAKPKFADAVMAMSTHAAQDKQTAKQLDALLSQFKGPMGHALGRSMAEKPTKRMISVLYTTLGEVMVIINDFKADPANRSTGT